MTQTRSTPTGNAQIFHGELLLGGLPAVASHVKAERANRPLVDVVGRTKRLAAGTVARTFRRVSPTRLGWSI